MAAAIEKGGGFRSFIPKGLLVDGSSLTLGKTLGDGGFARVFEARINLGSKYGGMKAVAFKKLHENVKALGAETLAAELLVQLEVDAHPNIVKVLGAVDDPGGIGFGLVLELAEFGTLYGLLREKSGRDLSWVSRAQILLDVAEGVQALHEHRPTPIVHNDLKSPNVLLKDAGDGSIVAKVGR